MTPQDAARELEGKSAEEVLSWALARFPGGKLVLATSFGAEDMVLLDMCSSLRKFPRVVTLDTGRLPQETYDLMESAKERYGAELEAHHPDAAELRALIETHGPNLFYRSVDLRRLCCGVRKVAPLRRALAGCGAWITGLRRGQSPERSETGVARWDEGFGLLKLSPLWDWSEEAVWARVKQRDIPVNRLHRDGYRSIGCAPCTRAVRPGEDERAGRWWWETGTKECGLHRDPGRPAHWPHAAGGETG